VLLAYKIPTIALFIGMNNAILGTSFSG